MSSSSSPNLTGEESAASPGKKSATTKSMRQRLKEALMPQQHRSTGKLEEVPEKSPFSQRTLSAASSLSRSPASPASQLSPQQQQLLSPSSPAAESWQRSQSMHMPSSGRVVRHRGKPVSADPLPPDDEEAEHRRLATVHQQTGQKLIVSQVNLSGTGGGGSGSAGSQNVGGSGRGSPVLNHERRTATDLSGSKVITPAQIRRGLSMSGMVVESSSKVQPPAAPSSSSSLVTSPSNVGGQSVAYGAPSPVTLFAQGVPSPVPVSSTMGSGALESAPSVTALSSPSAGMSLMDMDMQNGTQQKRRQVFAIRVLLPRDITTIILCDEQTRVADLMEKALQKLQMLLGIAFDRSHVDMAYNFPAGVSLLEPELVLIALPFIRQQVLNQETPVLELIYRSEFRASENAVSSTHSTFTEFGSSPPFIATSLNRSPVNRPRYDSLSMDYINVAPSSHLGTPSSTAIQGISPAVTSVLDVTSPSLPKPASQTTTDKSLRGGNDRSAARRSYSFAMVDLLSSNDGTSDALPPSASLQSVNSKSRLDVSTSKPVRPSSMVGIPRQPSRVFLVEFQFLDSVSLKMEVSGQDSVAQMKRNLWTHPQLPADIESSDQYRLLYTHPEDGYWVELFDEQQLVFMISVVNFWLDENQPFVFYVMTRAKPASKPLQLLNKKIGSLIGFGLYRFDYLKDFEVDVFRRNMVILRQDEIRKRDPLYYTLQPSVDSSPASATLLQRLGTGMKIHFRLHVQNQKMVKTLACAVNESPAKIISQFLDKNRFGAMATTKPQDFVLKVVGANEFLVGENPIIDFSHIRKCLMREERIELSLVPLNTISLAQPPLLEEFDVIEDPTILRATHRQLTGVGEAAESSNTLSLYDIAKTVSFQIVACERLQPGSLEAIYIEASLYHGGKLLAPTQYSHQVAANRDPRWNAWVNFDIAWYNVPRATKLCLTVWGRWNARKKRELDRENDVFPLGCVNFYLIDFRGFVKTGLQKLALLPGERANPIASPSGWAQIDDPMIFLRLDSFPLPVMVPALDKSDATLTATEESVYEVSLFSSSIDHLLCYNLPLQTLSKEESLLLWNQRSKLLGRPEALPHIIQSVNWGVLEDALEGKRFLSRWTTLSPDRALVLLDSSFADPDVRAYAVKQLETLNDHQLLEYLMQLIQALKYEPYLDNALTRFLLRRSLSSKRVGHNFFWYLRSEMDDQTVMLRHSLLLEAYLRGCGSYLDELIRQFEAQSKINEISVIVKAAPKNSTDRHEFLQNELKQISWPPKFQLALDPTKELAESVNEEFRVMDSKKLPLWCVFTNSDPNGDPLNVIYKAGDDLRQDMLTLQLIRVMDRLWQSANLDLYMMPYGCMSTSINAGFIEVVQNAETVSSIQLSYGGSSAAFRDQPIDEWLKKQNPNEADYEKAVETFSRSCAGYCVATYVLGIGDRHNDNIMVTKYGHLFHIDFGHFLGNIKRKFGFKRERAPFVLTPDFVYVIDKHGKDSEAFNRFVKTCVDAYLIIRRYSHLFITFFSLMVSTGIPELRSIDDLAYLKEALCLGSSEEEAAQSFKNLITESLRLGWSTQLNWWLHNLVHSR